MSDWIEVEDRHDVHLSPDGKTVDILYKTDDRGNCYIEVPVEWLREELKKQTKLVE